MIAPDAFRTRLEPGKWPKLEQASETMHKALADFIHGGDADSAGRTVAVSTLLFSLWQLSGSSMTLQPPSLVLINAHDGGGIAPMDALAAQLVKTGNYHGPQVHREGMFAHGTPKQARPAMANALENREERRQHATFPWVEQQVQTLEECFYAAQRTGFGHGRTRSYGGAWDEIFGLITERDCQVILRLDSDGDRAAFRQHVIGDPLKLQAALGYGPGLTTVSKRLCVSGALKPSEWDRELAEHTLGLGMAMIFLPDPVRKPCVDSLHPTFETMTSMLPRVRANALEDPANFVSGPWFARYATYLRSRLRSLPDDYDFLMQRMARQIFPVSLRLANWAGKYSGASGEESEAIARDLCAHALRGLAISVAGLAWHGYGLNDGIPRQEAMRVLDNIRATGPMSHSDVARGNRISKETRNQLVKCFAAQDLVKIDGKLVTATTYPEFVEALYAREEFPEPPKHWKATA
jgi:hypothetical protein